jgi:hypothetical protein
MPLRTTPTVTLGEIIESTPANDKLTILKDLPLELEFCNTLANVVVTLAYAVFPIIDDATNTFGLAILIYL